MRTFSSEFWFPRLAESEVAATSGAYSYGLARIVKDLSRRLFDPRYDLPLTHPLAGDYTMVVSAFEPRHLGPFVIRADCSQAFDLKAIPQEGAGMYNKTVRGAWYAIHGCNNSLLTLPCREEHTAGGGPNFERYTQNPIFEINVPSLAQLKWVLHPSQDSR